LAVLALSIAVALAFGFSVTQALAVGPLAAPISVRFELADGVRVAGQMTACDDCGFDGSFGRRDWTELEINDAWRLHTRVMDQQSAADWVNLGRVMLLMRARQPKGSDLADRAFRRAVQIDPSMQQRIEEVKDEVAEIERAARAAKREAEAQKLTTVSPEGGPWSADPWPALSEQEQAAALSTLRADAERVLQQAGTALVPVESPHFLIYSDLERAELAEWMTRLERVVTAMEFVLNPGIDPSSKEKGNVITPWGKVVVFIWQDHDRYRLVEADAFRHLVPMASVGVCHPIGPKVYVNMHRHDDEEMFEYMLIVETVHALLHHYRSPARLPAWANEGLAEFIAARANKHSHVRRDRRNAALEFIRADGNVNAVLDLTYPEGWPGPAEVGSGVGGLIVELMVNQKPQQFARWLNAIKTGKPWAEALREDYNVPREELVTIATQYWRVNN
jgi:hypothetical protein